LQIYKPAKGQFSHKARAIVEISGQVMREIPTMLRCAIVWPETPTVRARMQIFSKSRTAARRL